jgi:hypothetical protein
MADEIQIVDGKVILPGSGGYWWGYEYGQALDKAFPDQEAEDFGSCIAHNDIGPLTETNNVVGLVCEQVGERDGENWIWLVTLEDGTHWRLEGGCDYTGWDCQSNGTWTALNDGSPDA